MKLARAVGVFLVGVMLSAAAGAQQYLRIGTGGTGGTYYPIGVMIASVVSEPGKLIATAHASNGSLGNVIGVASGALESGFSQADVAAWAVSGTGIFKGRPSLPELRLIANLYPESLHVVVRKDAGIKTVADLRGRRVALDEPGSGTLINARQVLAAHGLGETDLRPEYIKPNQASDRFLAGTLDAFFLTSGTPAAAISELIASGVDIALLPIDGVPAERMRAESPFLQPGTIADGTYRGVASTPTLNVGAQWITSEKVDADLIYRVTRALYSEPAQKALASGHPKGRLITLANAVRGAAIPFHPGALRYYREAGVLK